MDTPLPRMRTSVSRRLIAGLLLLSLLASVVATSLQLAYDYKRRVELLQQDVDQRVSAIRDSLANTIWSVDPASTHLLLDGLARTPGVARVQLQTLDDERMEVGAAPGKPIDARRYLLLQPGSGGRKMGTMTVTLDDLDIRTRLTSRLRAIALVTLSVLSVGCIAIYLLYRSLLVRHLERIARYARKLDLDHLDQELVLDRTAHSKVDELDLVVAGFDRMRKRMAHDLALRAQHEAELERHRSELEQMVEERTQTLSLRNGELQARTLELEQARARAETLANTDYLTGVGNRRHFYAAADAALAAAFGRGTQQGIGAIMVDIDHFKQINDRYGHASGDRVIAEVAKRIQAALPADALLGRLGGEEFAALLHDTDLETLQALAERVRADVEAVPIGIGVLGPVACTASLGIALAGDGECGIDDLLGYADDALYQAKSAGRNRVVAWSRATAPATQGSQVRRRD